MGVTVLVSWVRATVSLHSGVSVIGTAAVGLVVGSEAVVKVDGGTLGFRLVGGTVGKV